MNEMRRAGIGTFLQAAALATALATTLAVAPGCTDDGADLAAHKELIRRFTDAVNSKDWTALESLATAGFARHSAATTGPPVRSLDEFVRLQQGFLVAFPDQHVTVEQVLAEGDRVAVRAIYRATNTGPLEGNPATGKAVEAPFIALFRIEDGRVAELWIEWDNLAMMRQLGVIPAAGPAAGPATGSGGDAG